LNLIHETDNPVIRPAGAGPRSQDCKCDTAEATMSIRRVAGLVLVVLGIVALLWGGVFWTDRDTVLDAGPLEIQTEDREGFAVPPVVGVIALIGGIILVVIPDRRRV
jgi:hypothetical protein